jgi:hypothetical protein
MTHFAFFSISGLLANSSNLKFLIKTNKIARISARANRYPIQFLVPPRNVRRLPQIPGICLVFSISAEKYRSGLYVSASGPQIAGDWFTAKIADCQSLVIGRG